MNQVSSAMITTLNFTITTVSELGLLELSVRLGNLFKRYAITMASIIPYLRNVSHPANSDTLSPGYNLGGAVRSLCLSCHPCGFCLLSCHQV